MEKPIITNIPIVKTEEIVKTVPIEEKRILGVSASGGFIWGFISTFLLIAVVIGAVIYFKKG